MYHATSRLSVLKFAAATGISIAAVATALPGVIGNITDLASASVQPTEQLATPESREIAARASRSRAQPVLPPRKRSVTSVEDLPSAGDARDRCADRAATIRRSRALQLRGADGRRRRTTCASPPSRSRHAPSRVPARTILARLPQAKPGRVFSVGPDGTVEANSGGARLRGAAEPASKRRSTPSWPARASSHRSSPERRRPLPPAPAPRSGRRARLARRPRARPVRARPA